MKKIMVLVCFTLLTGCTDWCWAYAKVSTADAMGDVSGASVVRATYENSIDGCAAVTSILAHRPEPYSDMFPQKIPKETP